MLLTPILKWTSAGLLFLCIMLGIALQIEKRHSAKLTERNAALAQKLDQLAAEAKQKQSEQKDTITRYRTQVLPQVEKRVEIVERAPLGKNCETPREVLGAGL